MLTVDDYLDAARAKSASKSDRDLAKLLGVAHGTVSQMRTKRIWPSDDLMFRIAKAAKLDAQQALLDLNIWRTTGPARSIYLRLAKALAAAAIAGFMIMAGQPKPALALGFSLKVSIILSAESIRYHKLRRLAGQWLRRFRDTLCEFAPTPSILSPV